MGRIGEACLEEVGSAGRVGGNRLIGAVSHGKVAVTVNAGMLSEVFVIASGLKGWGECICAVRVSGRGVSGTGCIATAGAAAVAVVMRWAILGIDVFATWIVHTFAVVADAEVAGLAWVVVAVVVVVAAVAVADSGVLTFVARWVAFNAVRGVVIDLGNLYLL